MLRRQFDRYLILALTVGGVVAACGGGDDDVADDDTTDSGASGGTSGASGTSGTTSSGASGTSGNTSSGNTSSGNTSSGNTSSGGSGTSSGSSGDLDASPDGDIEDLDAAFEAGPGPEDADAPDQAPVSFPATYPSLFGYKLVDAFPGAPLFATMDIAWPVNSTRPFVLHRSGYIMRLTPGSGAIDYLLDFSGSVYADAEAGALGLALHPKFADPVTPKPYAYVWYNANGSKQRLSRFTWHADTNKFDSEYVMVEQTEQQPFHNGAHLRFGPDGFLYFGNGDDQRDNFSTTQTVTGGLFSGVFRIDVDMTGGAVSHVPPRSPAGATIKGYYIPNDNPFVGVANASEEYWALGFRNPYSFNFDKQNGNLWLGDVGDTFREEIDQVVKGGNYGWPFFEGKKQNRTPAFAIGTRKDPLYDYTHASVADLSAIMGGYVYRGAALPEINGKLLFSDWPTGRVWALDTATGVRTSLVEHNNPEQNNNNPNEPAPLGCGQDNDGEIYFITWTKVYKLAKDDGFPNIPRKLSDTHIFRNLATLKTSTSLVPYSLRSPLWSDGAAKQRWIAVPPGQHATMNATGQPTLPAGTIIVKQFDLPDTANPVNRARRLETRVLVVGTTDTYGLSYRWNRDGSDADLVIDAADEQINDSVNPAESRLWHFPSFAECWSCHRTEDVANKRAQRILGFRGEQLNFDGQLGNLAAAGVFDNASIASSPAPMPSPSDANAPIQDRAFAYLASNCSPCHHPGASFFGGGDTWNANWGTALGSRGLVNADVNNYPMATEMGYGYKLVTPHAPQSSVLLGRVRATIEEHRMPPLNRTKVDPVADAVLTQWINSL